MATPHHHTFPTEEAAAETASAARAAPSHPAPATPRLPTPPQTFTPQPALCCVAEPQEFAHSLCGRGERSNPGSTAAQHIARRAPPRWLRCSPERAFLTACPPALLHGGTLWRTHPPETHTPRMSMHHAAAHSRASKSRAAHGGGAGVLTCKLVACSFCCAALLWRTCSSASISWMEAVVGMPPTGLKQRSCRDAYVAHRHPVASRALRAPCRR